MNHTKPGGFMRALKVNLLAALGCLWLCGCMTSNLWHERDYVVPSTDPKLALAQTSHDVLVQYDAVSERTGEVQRRAYFLEPNLQRIAAGKKPVFVDAAKAKLWRPSRFLRVWPATRRLPELGAVFFDQLGGLYDLSARTGLGPCDLPVFQGSSGKL